MKKFRLFSTALVVAAALFSAGCGEKGDPGPPGPPGNANVYSVYYTIGYNEWNVYATAGTPNHSIYFEKFIPDITQSVIDYGMVIGYIYDYDLDAWAALPYTYTFAGTQEFYKFYTTTGIAGIDITLNTLQTPAPQTTLDVKIVIVDGYARQANPDLNWNDYEQVRKRFNLE